MPVPLTLDPLAAAHAEEMYELLKDERLYRHLDQSPPASVQGLRETYLRQVRGVSADGRQRWLNWIVRTAQGRAVGFVQATLEQRLAWIAYVIGHAHQGHGYASEACRMMLTRLAETEGIEEILAVVESANAPSIALLRRLGFVRADAARSSAAGLSVTEQLFTRRATEGPVA
jgi:RimJ/RimL family protein N-acetyltransferase